MNPLSFEAIAGVVMTVGLRTRQISLMIAIGALAVVVGASRFYAVHKKRPRPR